MNSHRFFQSIWIVSFLIFQNTHGGTIHSSKGVGMPFFHPHTRYMGMGGMAIALSDPFTISRINPAGLYRIQTTRLSIQYFLEKNNYRDANASASSNYSNFDGFSFAIPFGSGVNFSAGLAPFTRMDYGLSFSENLGDESYTKSVEGEGGLNTFTVSLCWALRSNLALGFSGHYLFGRIKEKWSIEYDGSGFISSKDEFSTRNWGYGVTVGFIYRPFTPITLGAVFTPEIDINNQTEISYIYQENVESIPGSVTFPGSWGVGTSFRIGRIGLMGMEYSRQHWTRLRINGNEISGTHNTDRIAIGGEILPTVEPTAPFLKRIAYRLGFTYQSCFSLDPSQNTITEKWITVGLGIPLYMNAARIDIALSYGKRGSLDTNGLSENLLRLSLSITGGERWFIRRY